jgi:TonB family protein
MLLLCHKSEIRACYESELARLPDLRGTITVRLVITDTGSVSSATTAASTMGNAAVEGCLDARVKTWTFPRPKGGGVVVVTYPFVFSEPRHRGGDRG